jgi:hypothetical protein
MGTLPGRSERASPSRCADAALTLIGLLVVVGISAILAAVLLPAYANTRGDGQRFVCFNNLHRIGQLPGAEEGVAQRHGNGAGILGLDSRVLWISIANCNQETTNYPGLPYCVPGDPTGGQ